MPLKPGQTIKPLVKLPRDPAGCWEWLGADNGHGYPVKEYCGVTMPAARWLWLMLFGPLDPGIMVTHDCGSKRCMNPAHFRARDSVDVNRDTKSDFVPADIAEIRLLMDNGHPADVLAFDYGVHQSTIYRIASRKTFSKRSRAA